MKLRWSRQAVEDLLKIGRYIAADNPAAARRWVERLRQHARKTAEFPQAGQMVPEHSRPELREVIAGSYRIVYLVGADVIEVMTVFEGHQLLPDGSVPDPPKEE